MNALRATGIMILLTPVFVLWYHYPTAMVVMSAVCCYWLIYRLCREAWHT